MEKYKFQTHELKMMADLTTPVITFLKLREHFSEILLLESTEYAVPENSHSFICCSPLLTLQSNEGHYFIKNNENDETISVDSQNLVGSMNQFLTLIDVQEIKKHPYNGVFGFSSFDIVQEIENITFKKYKNESNIPYCRYDFYRYLLVFDHFKEQLTILENVPPGKEKSIEKILNIISRQDHQTYGFHLVGNEKSNISDEQFIQKVKEVKTHCQRGDVFQMVLSRRFESAFTGDEFNVYRALRAINPSPYLFYFDYTNFRIFGSSPEAQIVVKDNIAEIHPIAGTYRRTGNPIQDMQLAETLKDDPKENAEHIMLVDLARNDLSKNCSQVHVDAFRLVQQFSHVIHLVSKVKGTLNDNISGFQVFTDTFPAGTLSGAPKHKAIELIDHYENCSRSFYGGSIGFLNFNGDINHAIIIRSFLSTNQKLFYQAGAGIVIDSVPESELQEVKNKLAALRKSLEIAQTL